MEREYSSCVCELGACISEDSLDLSWTRSDAISVVLLPGGSREVSSLTAGSKCSKSALTWCSLPPTQKSSSVSRMTCLEIDILSSSGSIWWKYCETAEDC